MMSIEKIKNLNKKISPKNYIFPPNWIILGVNNVCNLHCKMCDVGTKSIDTNFAQNLVGTHPINMPFELVEKIVNEMNTFFPKSKLALAFTEPLVYPHLEKTLNYAHEKGIETSITTNGLTLKQKAEIVAQSNIFVSLDGPQEIHNEIRGHKKSFQKAIAGIDAVFKINKKAKISIFCVITEWNIGYLNTFLDFFKDYPLQQIGFMQSNFTKQHIADQHNEIWSQSYPATASNVDEVNIDNFDLDLLWEEIINIKSKSFNFPVTISPNITSKEKLHEYYHKPEVKLGKMCNDVFTNVMIKSNGNVIPAHGRCYNLDLGNIYNENLKQIWNGRVLKEFRSTLSKNNGLLPACSRCCSAF